MPRVIFREKFFLLMWMLYGDLHIIVIFKCKMVILLMFNVVFPFFILYVYILFIIFEIIYNVFFYKIVMLHYGDTPFFFYKIVMLHYGDTPFFFSEK